MADEIGRGLADLNGRFFGLLWQKFVVQGGHFAVGSNIVLLETLLLVGVLVHQGTYCGAKDVHYSKMNGWVKIITVI